MPWDSFSKTTVTPKDPSSKIFNYFQNIIVAFLEKSFFLEKYFLKQNILIKHITQFNIINKMHDNIDTKLKTWTKLWDIKWHGIN